MLMHNNDFYTYYNRYIKNNYGSIFSIDSDNDPGQKLGNELEAREKIYTKLLSNYSKITRARSILKEIHKWLFFWIIIVAGIIMVVFSCKIITRVVDLENTDQFLESAPIILTAFASFLTAIIGIPTTITKFLFNEKEDDNITTTIHDTQRHDFEEITLLKDRYTRTHHNDTKEATESISTDSD